MALIVLASSIAFAQSVSPATTQQNGTETTGTLGTVSTSSTAATLQAVVADSKILEILHEQKAFYPNDAERARVQGEVVVRVQVSESGDVEKTEVVGGDPLLVDAAVDAAKKFKFKPFIRNGKPVKVTTKLPFDFHFFDKVVSDGLPYENGKGGSGNSTPDANPVKRIKVSSGVAQAMIIRKVAPAYPPDARGNGIQGTVVLHAIIGKDGHILSLTPISGTQELIRASIGAVQQWVYRPYLLMGEPVEVDTQVTVNFSLNRF